MIKKGLTLLIALSIILTVKAQYSTVNYEYQKNYFNEGKPLPAEELILFTGKVKNGVSFVQIELYDKKGTTLLHEANWRSSGDEIFSIPFNYRLYPSEEYDFRISYFQPLAESEKEAIKQQLLNRFNTFIDGNTKRISDKMQLNKSANQMYDYFNTALHEVALQYQPAIDLPGQMTMLSDAVKDKLKTIDGQSSENEAKTISLLQELKAQIESEVERIFSRQYVEIVDSKYIDNYETEQKRSSISMNLGYGGVYLEGGVDDLTYGASPFVGLAFPLGNNRLAPVLGNASITLGVFTDNFENRDGLEVTGFVAPRPIYLGLDYKLFQFIRFNAGATLLETTGDGMSNSEVIVRPFVGLGVRINWSVTIDR